VLADRVAQFAIAGREAVASGIAVNNPAGFAAELRRVGDLLARSSSGNEDTLAAELDTLTAAIRALQPGAPPVPADTRMRAAPVPPPAAAAPRPTTGGALPETPDLAGSWAMFERLVVAGVGPASLEELVGGAGSRAPRAPAPPPAVARPGPAPAAAADLPVVDVAVLLYRGERALQRAQELRATAQRTSGDALRTLVEEVCDLVALALEPSP
jgi:hypothetical protein